MKTEDGTIAHRTAQLLKRFRPSSAAEFGGLAAVIAGVWQIFEPAAWILGGLGVVLWAQGRRPGKGDGG